VKANKSKSLDNQENYKRKKHCIQNSLWCWSVINL